MVYDGLWFSERIEQKIDMGNTITIPFWFDLQQSFIVMIQANIHVGVFFVACFSHWIQARHKHSSRCVLENFLSVAQTCI